ncbi:unnamed protein product [Dovyalis caffra]|uniref:DNA-directed RNA polymerase III subunit RPC9 n=1 Tax=Dovyalis caffra TaxID=77055 RepID=A0AAV1SN72_9ROSI|nr:unnamed protein product [Dovyalis caffra]
MHVRDRDRETSSIIPKQSRVTLYHLCTITTKLSCASESFLTAIYLPFHRVENAQKQELKNSTAYNDDDTLYRQLTPSPSASYNSSGESNSPLTTTPLSMKIKNPNAGALTNFEVLDFLRSRGASKDVSRVLAPVATSEYKVYDYLVDTPACNQTREKIIEFVERCKKYDLAKAEVLNIINIRPSQTVEIYTIIEELEARFEMPVIEELVELVEEVLPPPPGQQKAEGGTDENEEEHGDGEENNEENEAADEEEPEAS